MSAFHSAVVDRPAWKRYDRDLKRAEDHYARTADAIRAAEAEHAEVVAEYRGQLDAGTAPTAGPPMFHPPADAGKLQADRLALRTRRRAVLAELADDAEADLRDREAPGRTRRTGRLPVQTGRRTSAHSSLMTAVDVEPC